MRLRSDFYVSALLHRCTLANLDAVLLRRGAAEAGAIFVQLDDLAGHIRLYGPKPQSEAMRDGRGFVLLHKAPVISTEQASDIMAKQVKFDRDLWLIEIEDRNDLAFRALLADH